MEQVTVMGYVRGNASKELDNMDLYPTVTVVYATGYALLAVVGSFGNTLLLISICSCRSLRTTANMFIVNLAVADLVVSGLVDSMVVTSALVGRKYFLERWVLCEFLGAVCCTGCTLSVINAMAISINRYVCICKNQRYLQVFSKWKTCIMIALLWLISSLPGIAMGLGWGRYVYDEKYMACLPDRMGSDSIAYTIVVVYNIIPLSVVGNCYTLIWLKVRESKRKVEASKSNGATYMKNTKMYTEIRLAKTLFSTALVLVLMSGPYGILSALDRGDVLPMGVHMIAGYLLHLNSAVNWIVYGATNGKFRRTYQKTLSLLCRCRHTPSTFNDEGTEGTTMSHTTHA